MWRQADLEVSEAGLSLLARGEHAVESQAEEANRREQQQYEVADFGEAHEVEADVGREEEAGDELHRLPEALERRVADAALDADEAGHAGEADGADDAEDDGLPAHGVTAARP
ncbi:hypothetical protein C5E16_14360 [Clavibacter michiganensis]|uniref:Uncharacterized protein n=1 Tax=Clavibacter michiganensis TaxID=28447 RepID=A0A2S5VNX8_9MICO|nr:hypothetical protein C5E16_14360 [Clavibacter michiganensis]